MKIKSKERQSKTKPIKWSEVSRLHLPVLTIVKKEREGKIELDMGLFPQIAEDDLALPAR